MALSVFKYGNRNMNNEFLINLSSLARNADQINQTLFNHHNSPC